MIVLNTSKRTGIDMALYTVELQPDRDDERLPASNVLLFSLANARITVPRLLCE